jgi:hypothetical protein
MRQLEFEAIDERHERRPQGRKVLFGNLERGVSAFTFSRIERGSLELLENGDHGALRGTRAEVGCLRVAVECRRAEHE